MKPIIIFAIFFSIIVKGQNIYTIAGIGTSGPGGGDGGPANMCTMTMPIGIALDGFGNIYFSETNCIRKITASTGVITTFAGNPSFGGYMGDGGLATLAKLNTPYGIAFDVTGNMYIADNGNKVIRKIDITGTITTIAGGGTSTVDGIPATTAQLNSITSIVVDTGGNIYLDDISRVRKISPSGIISTVAGNGTIGHSGDNGPATSAQIQGVGSLAINGSGELFIQAGNHCIRKVNTSGIITTIAGIPGSGGYSGDNGPATSAQIYSTEGITVDNLNNIYFSDNDRVIRKIDPFGIISTISGTIVVWGYNGSGIPANSAVLNFPMNLITDPLGNLYFCDRDNNRVREICFSSCLAGITENNKRNDFQIYPNPVSDFLVIKSDQYFEPGASIEITNTLGQTVLKLPYKNEIDVSGISNGCYFLKITTAGNRTYHSKFVKQ